MTIKASGRLALILAAGLLVCFAESSQAAGAAATANPESDTAAAPAKTAKHSAHHWKKYAHRRSGKVALKPPADNKVDNADAVDTPSAPAPIPPSVADANARMASPDSPTDNAMAMSARANEILQTAPHTPAAVEPVADAQVVATDQLNDVDRTLHDSAPPPAPVMTMAAAEAPATPAPLVAASSDESSTTDETSLIGKIFIGFGALLTMASAARMFMA
jgi:hypothetical protein